MLAVTQDIAIRASKLPLYPPLGGSNIALHVLKRGHF